VFRAQAKVPNVGLFDALASDVFAVLGPGPTIGGLVAAVYRPRAISHLVATAASRLTNKEFEFPALLSRHGAGIEAARESRYLVACLISDDRQANASECFLQPAAAVDVMAPRPALKTRIQRGRDMPTNVEIGRVVL